MFGGALGDLVPLALVIALSPIPIVACILMLFSPRGRANGPAFLIGWVVGITVVTVAVRLVSGAAGGSDDAGDGPDPAALVTLILGVVVLSLGVRQWRARPAPDAEVELPGWMAGVDSVSPGRALGLGVLLSAVNPKNLTMAVAAGVAMGEAIAAGADPLALEIVFVLLASSSVGTLVLYALLGGTGAQRRMEGWRTWLIANNAAVMAVLLVVIGGKLVGSGLDGLLG